MSKCQMAGGSLAGCGQRNGEEVGIVSMGVKNLSGRKLELERLCQGGCKCLFSISSQTHLGFPHPTIICLSLQLLLTLCLLALELHNH